jgi:AraC-like DNA-binding protein
MRLHDSALVLQHRLGGYRQFAPPAALARSCEAVWVYRTPPLGAGAVHRVLPDPALDIVFAYRRDSYGHILDAGLFAGGPTTTPHLAAFRPGREIVAIKMKLEWMRAALGLEPADIQDATVMMSAVEPRLADAFLGGLSGRETIETATTWLITTVTRHLAGRERSDHRTRRVAAHALDIMRLTHGRCDVGYVAGQMGFSTRYIRRAVDRNAHVSLKAYAQTVRLVRAITMADTLPPGRLSWARVAIEAGYFDQAHFIRECRAVCGLTPGQVLEERRSEADDAPLM